MADKKFGELLRIHRGKAGLTQQELANRLGLKNKSTLGTWELGKAEPDYGMIAKLCDAFNVDANTLLGWESDITPVITTLSPDGKSFAKLEGDDLADSIAEFASLPPEALGDARLYVEFLHYKYSKNREA